MRMIQKAAAMATGDWQLHYNNLPAHASHLVQRFLVKHQITQVTQPPYSPDLVPCDFWLFPELKPPLKGKRFHTVDKIQENRTGQLMVIGRTVWGPKVPPLKGTEVPLSYVLCFLYLLSSSVNISIFYITWLHTSWAEYIYTYIKKWYGLVQCYVGFLKCLFKRITWVNKIKVTCSVV